MKKILQDGPERADNGRVGQPAGATIQGRKADVLYLLMLLAGLAGFWIIGKDTATIATLPKAPRAKEAPVAKWSADPGSFPAPTDLKGWTQALAACARPGPHVKFLADSFPGGPAQKMAAIYATVGRDFHYEADVARDWFTPADILAQPGRMRGDCKQIATLLYASALQMGIGARMIATGSTGSAPGHVHTEILLARPQEDPSGTLEVMGAVWGAVEGRDASSRPNEIPLAWTAHGVFLILDGGIPPSKYQRELGPVQAVIESGPTDRREKQ